MQHKIVGLTVVVVVIRVGKQCRRVDITMLRTVCEVEHRTQVESYLETVLEERAHDVHLRILEVPFRMALWRHAEAALVYVGGKESHLLLGPIVSQRSAG